MEDTVILETKDYAQVIFEDVQEFYNISKDLVCLFTLNEFYEIDKSDFIGIYKVGFTKCKDYLISLEISLSEINENNKGKLIFEADKLPKEDNEYYQFVYMSMGKQIRGASLPFQFKQMSHMLDDIEVDDKESAAIVLKLKESELNETLSEMKHKCENLSQANETFERLVKENDELTRMLKDELTNVKMRCLRLTLENEKINFTLQKVKSDLKRNETTVAEQTQTIQTILMERDSLNSLIENLTKEKSDLESSRDKLAQDLLVATDKSTSVEQCKEVLCAQLAISNSELDNTKKKLNEAAEELSRLVEKDKLNEYEKIDLLEKMNKMKDEYEFKLEQSNGSYFALNLAHTHLENRTKLNQTKHEKESQEHKDLIDALKLENENLKQRIRVSACEFAFLNNKYLKLKNAFRLTKSMSTSCIFSNKYEDMDSVLEGQTLFERDNTVLKTGNDEKQQKIPESKISSFQHVDDYLDDTCDYENHLTINSTNVDLNNNHNEPNTQVDNRNSIVHSNCEICDYAFPKDYDVYAYEVHMSTHYGPSCPVCFFTFRKGYPQSDFENHVNSHFTS